MADEPLDVLEDLLGEKVSVRRDDGDYISGTLDSFDHHINLEVGDTIIRGKEVIAIHHSAEPEDTTQKGETEEDSSEAEKESLQDEIPSPGTEFTIKIDRINSNGNGMSDIGDRTINFGPIKEEKVEETVRAKMIDDTFAKCLDPDFRRYSSRYPNAVVPEYIPDSGGVFSDMIDRISQSGNGVIEVGRFDVNIGPVKEDSVGEIVEVEMLTGQYGKCLSEEVTEEGYEAWVSDIVGKEQETEQDTESTAEKVDKTDPQAESEEADTVSQSVESQSETSSVVEELGRDDSRLSKLRRRAVSAASDDPVRDTSGTVGSRYVRAPAIKQYAKARADGVCEYCSEPAPFKTVDGEPYLEVHHVDELGEGGMDHPDKVVALCPTCHKRIHHGKDGEKMNQDLKEKLEDGLADIGVEG